MRDPDRCDEAYLPEGTGPGKVRKKQHPAPAPRWHSISEDLVHQPLALAEPAPERGRNAEAGIAGIDAHRRIERLAIARKIQRADRIWESVLQRSLDQAAEIVRETFVPHG